MVRISSRTHLRAFSSFSPDLFVVESSCLRIACRHFSVVFRMLLNCRFMAAGLAHASDLRLLHTIKLLLLEQDLLKDITEFLVLHHVRPRERIAPHFELPERVQKLQHRGVAQCLRPLDKLPGGQIRHRSDSVPYLHALARRLSSVARDSFTSLISRCVLRSAPSDIPLFFKYATEWK